ncbi:MAG: hypothetical protein KAJ51_18100, partial [Thermoplasmata archaeon]|nr:hypothetical protein [Thermoplasmata archaeon]
NDDRYTNSISVILSLHSEDSGSGVDLMSFSLNGTVWFGWQSFETNRTIDLPTGDGEKIIYFKVKDKADNIAGPIVDSIILDTIPPEELSVVINENAKFTNSTLVTLVLNAYDSLSGISEMSFSTDTKTWTSWETFNWTESMNLSAGDGEKIIYFRVRDKANNTAEPIFSSIILDTTPPHSLSILINNGALETNSTLVTLKLNASDALSGIYLMSFSTDGENWDTWRNYTNTILNDLSDGDGEKTIYFRVKDRAGNIAEPASATIFLDTSLPSKSEEYPPIIVYWIISIFIFIFIIVLIIGILIKKRKDRLGQKEVDSAQERGEDEEEE